MANFEFVPESAFSRVFDYYGFPQSSFLLFSGILFSGLGFEDIVNPAFWTVSCIVAIFIAYSLRSYIPASYGWVFLAILVAVMTAIAGGFSDLGKAFFSSHWAGNELESVLLRFATLTLVAVIVAIGFVSHRKHSDRMLLDLPTRIVEPLKRNVIDNPFFYRNFQVEIFVERVGERLRADVDIQTRVQNRTQQEQVYAHTYSKVANDSMLKQVKVGGRSRDILDPNTHTRNAIKLSDTVPPGGAIDIEVKITDWLPVEGSEIFTCYSMPAETFRLAVFTQAGVSIETWLDILSADQARPERSDGCLIWESAHGMLPNQGVRLCWRMIQ